MFRRPVLSGLAVAVVVAIAGIAVAALSPWSGDAPTPTRTATLSASSVAPASSPKVTQHRIYGTDESAGELSAGARDEIPGPAGSSDATTAQSDLQPLPVSAFRAPVARYRAYAEAQSRAMAVPVRALIADLRAGHRAAAEADWGAAYDRYLLLGAAYGALGDLDQAIDGGPGGLPKGVHDPSFTGLHRVERELWTGTPTAAIVPWAVGLRRNVAKLPHAIAVLEITPLDYATRAHEILEDAQRDQLSGVAAPWSGAGVAATAAGAQATERVIATLRPTLAGRESTPQAVQTELRQLRQTLGRIRADHHGRYPRLDALTATERAHLSGSLGIALEALSQVPGALETARPPIVKAIPR